MGKNKKKKSKIRKSKINVKNKKNKKKILNKKTKNPNKKIVISKNIKKEKKIKETEKKIEVEPEILPETKHTKPEKTVKEARVKKEKIDSMEQLYKLINTVQIEKKEASITIDDDSIKPIILNILKDSDMKFQENRFGKKTLIRMIPDDKDYNEDIDLENIDRDFIFDVTLI